MSQTHKRHPFDASLLAGPPAQPIRMPHQSSPSKKPRTSDTSSHPSHASSHQSRTSSSHPPPHAPQFAYHIPSHPSDPFQSAEYTPTSTFLDPSILPVPQPPLGLHVGIPKPQPPSFQLPKSYVLGSSSIEPLPAEIYAAGLSDAQRRTEALLLLQRETDLRDDEVVDIMAEFEGSVAAADTYLAIKRDGLRRMWLMKLVKRRKR